MFHFVPMYMINNSLDMKSICDSIVPCTSKPSPTATLPPPSSCAKAAVRARRSTNAPCLTHWPKDKIERLRRVLKNEPLVHPDQLFLIERSLPHGHVEILLEVVRKLKLPALIDPRPSPKRDRVLAMILQRLLHPASKLATTRLWQPPPWPRMSLEDTDEDDLYEAMDWLLERQDRIERKLAKRHLAEGDPVLYDVSSSYYEGRTCPLMQFGHNRDGKRDRPIVVYGVLADSMGRPLAVQAYAGNTGDPTTVPDQVEKVRGRFGLQRVVLVGDRGLLTETQINHLKRHPGLGWVSALRHHQIRRLVESEAVQLSLFDERHLAEVRSPDYPGERLIVCHNPLLAEHRRQKREALLTATEEALARIARQVARRTRTPLSATEIAEKLGRVKNASRWPNTSGPRSQTGPSTMSGARKPSSGRRNWTGSTC